MPEDIDKFFDVQDLAIHINPTSFLGNQNGQPGRMILPDLRSAFCTYKSGILIQAVDSEADVIDCVDRLSPDVNIRMMFKKSSVLMYCLMDTGQEYQTKSKNYD